jgi:glycosyltransferase involved in cell wall biosynthesis
MQFLSQTIDSVRSQNYRNYEHIFVDGGSGDGTLELISRVAGDVKLEEKVHGGIARAMNAGIEIADGDVILHLHSDDYLAHPRVLARVAKIFESKGCEWMYGRTMSDVGGGWAPETPQLADYSYARLLQGNIIPHPATFVRRRMFTRAGLFDETLRFAMDYDMWLRLGKLAEPVRIPEFLSVFRVHAGSATYANRMASFLEDHAVRKRYLSANPFTQLNHALRHLKRRRELTRFLASKARTGT